ncbi:MAG: peptide ABC transporter substrate-binding protein [Alphaproteobacteria bacterium]|jgi:peptide/nickel transport system substrate-binding protein|nr:peptide ABC transporter substrate-binding protein [Alphaproteobacteria bacterium]
MPIRRISRRALLSGALGIPLSTIIPGAVKAQGSNIRTRGGHLRVGLNAGSATDSLDPVRFYSSYQSIVGYSFANNLVEIGDTGELIPELAESWESDTNFMRWKFRLREDVTFHHGKSLSSEDVIYSLQRHMQPESGSGGQPYLRDVIEMRSDGPKEVIFLLRRPQVSFPYFLSDYHLLITPADLSPDAGVGTGAYLTERFEPGVVWEGRRNTGYWKSDRANVDTVSLLVINESLARLAALRSGSVDVINQVDPGVAPALENDNTTQLVQSRGRSHVTFPMQMHVQPFANPQVRTALKLLFDRQAIVDQVYNGYGQIGNDHPISPADPFYSEIGQRSPDPDLALSLLRRAGVDQPIVLHASDIIPRGIQLAETFQAHATRIGVDLRVRRHPQDGYWSNVWAREPWCLALWSGRPTPEMMFSVAYASNASWNETGWESERFDFLLSEAGRESNADTRYEIFSEMQELVRDDCGTVIPVFLDWLDAARSRVRGLAPSIHDELLGKRVAEKVWLEGA